MRSIALLLIIPVILAGCTNWESGNAIVNQRDAASITPITSATILTPLKTTIFTPSTTTLYHTEAMTTVSYPTILPNYVTTLPSIEKKYEWKNVDGNWVMNIPIPQSIYNYYASKPRTFNDYSVYARDTYGDAVIGNLVNILRDGARKAGYNGPQTVNMVVLFVQSLPDVPDDVSTGKDEYPRYPMETLWDNGGDCEDTAILTAKLLKTMGYDVVLFEIPPLQVNSQGHMAVGVWSQNVDGTYVNYNGRNYYYLETTGTGWTIGQIPSEFKNRTLRVLAI